MWENWRWDSTATVSSSQPDIFLFSLLLLIKFIWNMSPLERWQPQDTEQQLSAQAYTLKLPPVVLQTLPEEGIYDCLDVQIQYEMVPIWHPRVHPEVHDCQEIPRLCNSGPRKFVIRRTKGLDRVHGERIHDVQSEVWNLRWRWSARLSWPPLDQQHHDRVHPVHHPLDHLPPGQRVHGHRHQPHCPPGPWHIVSQWSSCFTCIWYGWSISMMNTA